MKQFDHDGLLLCEIQGKVFEQSLDYFDCSSEIFVRRFSNSFIATIFDSTAILDDTLTPSNVLDELNKEYDVIDFGSNKYSYDVMYWMGYLYRYFCYTYEINMKQAYKLLKPDLIARSYLGTHTLGCAEAIERLLESQNIDLSIEYQKRKAIEIAKSLRK